MSEPPVFVSVYVCRRVDPPSVTGSSSWRTSTCSDAELKPRGERILGQELNLSVDAVVGEHATRGAQVEIRRVRRAERREAAGRVEDRVGAGDRPAPERAEPVDRDPDRAVGDRRIAVLERANDRCAARPGRGRAPEGGRRGNERTRDRERREQARTEAA